MARKKSLEAAKRAAVKRQTSFFEALEAWQEVLALYPHDLETRHNVAALLIRRKRYDEAQQIVDHLAEDDGEAVYMRGELAVAARAWEPALVYFTRVEAAPSRHELKVKARDQRIAMLIELERFADALALEMEKPTPASWHEWEERGQIQLRCRDHAGAAVSLNRATVLQPRAGTSHLALARALALGGEATRAMDALANAVRLDYEYTLWATLAADPDFATLRDEPKFVELTSSPLAGR